MSRYDYVKYDSEATRVSEAFKAIFENLDNDIDALLPSGSYKEYCLTKLEEAYMYIGKALRDATVARAGQSVHKPERDHS